MPKYFLLISILLGFEAISQNNDLDAVVEKFKPINHQVVHKPIQTNIWGFKNVIIVFYAKEVIHEYLNEKYSHNAVSGFLLIPDGKNYKNVLIDVFEDDNVDTEILSVFFANANNDLDKELIILTSNEHRLQYLYEGIEYNIAFYKSFKKDKIPQQMKTLENDKLNFFHNNFDGFKDERNWNARFKNSESIKKALKQLGY